MAAIDRNVLHRRMGHIGIDRLQRMVTKGQLKGINTVLGSPRLREPCVLGKRFEKPRCRIHTPKIRGYVILRR